MSIVKLRKVESEAVDIFNDTSEYKKYLNCVAETYSYRWYNSMLYYKHTQGKNCGLINTETGWNKEGYSIKSNESGFDILVPVYKTEFISEGSGDVMDVRALSSNELGNALMNKFIRKRSYTSDIKSARVFTKSETTSKNIKSVLSDTDISNIKDMFEHEYGIKEEYMQKGVYRVIMAIINKMKVTKDIVAVNIRAFEKTIITGSVQYIVMKYIDDTYDNDMNFVNSWLKAVNEKEYKNTIKIRCLDQISLIAGNIIGKINEVIGVSSGINEEIIDKNYNLRDILKAAEADIVNTEIHNI